MPLSWLLLEQWKWGVVPQIQPMRTLLFVTLSMQFLCAVAGVRAGRSAEAVPWFALAFLLPLQPVVTGPFAWGRIVLAVALGLAAAMAARWAPAVAVAAFFAVPWVGGVVNYPRLHTPELAQLSAWARVQYSAGCGLPVCGYAAQPGSGHLPRRGAARHLRGLEGRRPGQLPQRFRRAMVVPLAADPGAEIFSRRSAAI